MLRELLSLQGICCVHVSLPTLLPLLKVLLVTVVPPAPDSTAPALLAASSLPLPSDPFKPVLLLLLWSLLVVLLERVLGQLPATRLLMPLYLQQQQQPPDHPHKLQQLKLTTQQ